MTLTEQVNNVIASLTTDIKSNKLSLPSPPDLLIKIRHLMANDTTSSSDIAELVKHDANISGRLIKVANSAIFAARNPSSTVNAAVSRLGFKKVQNLITGLAISQNFISLKMRGLEKYLDNIWQQSNKVAALSYVLASKKSTVDPEQALLAGMVHNIGILPLILRLNSIPELKENSKVYLMVADVVVPKLYPSAGKLIMENWNFPKEIIQISTEHRNLNHQAESDNITDLADVVIVAYQLAQLSDLNALPEEGPEVLIQSPSFLKFWPNWQEAVTDLSSMMDDVDEMQHSMTS